MKIPLLISLQFFSRRFYWYRSTVHEIVSSTHRRQNYEIMYVEKRMHTIAYMMRTIIFTSKSVSYFSPHQKRREKKIISYLPPAACLTLSLITRHFNAWDIFNMNCTRIHRKYANCLSFSLALFLLFFFFNRFSFSQSIGITIRKLIYLFVLIRPLIKATNRIVIFVFTSSFSVINVCFSI